MDYEKHDKIFIRDLLMRAIIGINPDERINKQDVVLNITLYTSQRQAASSDDFSLTVDYKSVKQAIMALVEQSSFGLIEALAQAVADKLLSFEGVSACRVTLDKPGALRFARSVAVEILRTN